MVHIALNVGGYLYETTRETVMKSKLLSERIQTAEKNSCGDTIFLDRDGVMFNCILNYMRTGYIWAANFQHSQILRIEAEYFGLEDAIAQLDLQEAAFKSNTFYKP